MGQVSTINKLPVNVKEELHKRIVCSDFFSYDELTLWLQAKGYPISRSSLHRYVTAYKEDIINSHNEDVVAKTYLRLECIKIASTINPNQNLADLKTSAMDILNWVIKG